MTDARILRSRAGLRQALLDLLEAKPFEQITIRDVTAAAGVNYTTYFRHYTSKEALLGDLAVEAVRDLHDLTAPLYDQSASLTACRAVCDHVGQNRPLWSALLAGAAGFVREEMVRLATRRAADPFERRLPEDLRGALIVSGMIELLSWWLRQASPPPAADVGEIMDLVVVRPALTPAPSARP